ncbi:metalloprotease PmbA [Buchnera aphidicola]|uniref:metalloprotease PmbA n=1 Tax=Buchnera aphidicola TaxID=9 RepID=UPI0031B84E67
MYEVRDVFLEERKLKDIAITCIELAKNQVDSIEVKIKKTQGMNVTVRKGIAEYIEFSNDSILFLTVYKKNCKGSASSTNFRTDVIKKTLQAAITIAENTSIDCYAGLPHIKNLAIDDKIIDLNLLHPKYINLNHAFELALLAENAAFKFDSRIVNSEGVSFSSALSTIVCCNSIGLLQGYSTSLYSLSCGSIAQSHNIMQRDYSYSIARKIDDLNPAQSIGEESAKRSIARLYPKKINSIKSPVIFSSEVSPSFFYHFANAINGYNVNNKSTFLLNELNNYIFPKFLSISDNPHIKKGLGSKPFDNEGVYTRTQLIVNQGKLISWLLDSYTAIKLGLNTTGHSGGIHNLLIQDHLSNNVNFINLLKYMNTGLLVTELMGDGVNITTGDYSRGIFGFWIENGVVQYSVSEVTISGNLKQMFQDIIKISNDININSCIKCGSLLLSNMQISGL